ncbi:MAG: glycine--tRNA ligase subunit beta [Alphaproteobacteria bacterium]|nr:glycine--tRNA ligase subunit beta [Alphaproteobacteria bacterium]
MAELLLELFSEEIPARMQEKAAADFSALVKAGLDEAGLKFDAKRCHVTPRRLSLIVQGLPATQPDKLIEKKGPKVTAAPAAIAGFAKSSGVHLEQLEKRAVGGEECFFAVIRQKGVTTAEALLPILEQAIAGITWPKSMRWGSGGARWVRPLHSILCLFDGKVLPVSFAGIKAGNVTYGHRFHAPGSIQVENIDEYLTSLREARVVLDREERREKIWDLAREKAAEAGLEIRHDNALLDEVTGLVEYPVVLIGEFDKSFLTVPPEALNTVMRSHQKYFALYTKDGSISNRFLFVANLKAADGGANIIVGNERVLKARLSDGKFFWDLDRKTPLASRNKDLESIVFHARLGTVAERVKRIALLAEHIAKELCFDATVQKHVARAASLCKADLVSGMVGEFAELQGIMGRYYALDQKEPQEIADAIRDHYAPQGPSDACPKAPVSLCVALAEKLDTLAGMFAIGEKPTGSKDPFALRRAALGIIRLILENSLKLPLKATFGKAVSAFPQAKAETVSELIDFIADRLKVGLKEQAIRHDVISAVFGTQGDDLTQTVSRAKAVQKLLETPDGDNLLAGYKRAENILKKESAKDKADYKKPADAKLLSAPEEKDLHAAIAKAKPLIDQALKSENYEAAMAQLASLRQPIDRFFDKVLVNDKDAAIRTNRLHLLSEYAATCNQIADFSQIEGSGESLKAAA